MQKNAGNCCVNTSQIADPKRGGPLTSGRCAGHHAHIGVTPWPMGHRPSGSIWHIGNHSTPLVAMFGGDAADSSPRSPPSREERHAMVLANSCQGSRVIRPPMGTWTIIPKGRAPRNESEVDRFPDHVHASWSTFHVWVSPGQGRESESSVTSTRSLRSNCGDSDRSGNPIRAAAEPSTLPLEHVYPTPPKQLGSIAFPFPVLPQSNVKPSLARGAAWGRGSSAPRPPRVGRT
jgi:hypothetical protein